MLLFPQISPEQAVTGRRARLPISLLYSRHRGHSPLAVATYGVFDILGGGSRDVVVAGREWLAARLDCSVSGLAKALAALSVEHAAVGAVAGVPRLLTSWRRPNAAAARVAAVPTPEDGDGPAPWVDVPEWTLGDASGPLVSHKAWRFYAMLLHKRTKAGAVALLRRELAGLIRVRADSLPALIDELAAAGMVVVDAAPGCRSVIMPITRRADAVAAAEWHARLACAQPVDEPADGCGQRVDDGSSTGTSLHPSTGTSPHPSAGTSNESPDLGSPDLCSPVVVAPQPPAPAASPRAAAPLESDREVRATPAAAAATPWCGRCDNPRTRRRIDERTGYPAGACPTCSHDHATAAA